jgi:uncharacterized protein (DUF302 family)
MTSATDLSVFLDERLDVAIEHVVAALKARGFGMLTDIDVQATLKEKLGTDFYPYRLLGVCNPALAYRALEIDPAIGVFLPCTVAIYDTGNGCEVHIQDPAIALREEPSPDLAAIVVDARAGLGQVISDLQAPVDRPSRVEPTSAA